MTIYLYSASQKDGQRIFNFIKTIDIDFTPSVGFKYFDKENKIVYSITSIFFTDKQISAVIEPLDNSRLEPTEMLFYPIK